MKYQDDKRALREIMIDKIPDICLQESFPKIINFSEYTKYIIKVKLQGKPLPCFIDLDHEHSEEIFFYMNLDGTDPTEEKYDFEFPAGQIKIVDSMFKDLVRKPRSLRLLAYSKLRIAVIANLRFSYPQKNSKVFQKGQIFSTA
jgi:hypothetical protein